MEALNRRKTGNRRRSNDMHYVNNGPWSPAVSTLEPRVGTSFGKGHYMPDRAGGTIEDALRPGVVERIVEAFGREH